VLLSLFVKIKGGPAHKLPNKEQRGAQDNAGYGFFHTRI